MLYFNATKNKAVVYLSGFFFLLSLYGLYEYVLLYARSVLLITLFLLNFATITSLLYLIGPMLYLYVRSLLSDNARLTKRDCWHLLPMVIFFVAAIPYSFVPMIEKISVAIQLIDDPSIMQTYKTTFLAEIFSVPVIYLSRPLLVLAYISASVTILVKYLRQNEDTKVFSRQSFMVNWLVLLLGLLMILVVSHVLLVIKFFLVGDTDFLQTLTVLQFLSVTGLSGILVSPFFFPSILYGMPRVPEAPLPVTPVYSRDAVLKGPNRSSESRGTDLGNFLSGKTRVTPAAQPAGIRKTASQYEKGYLHFIGKKADSFMHEHKPYLQPDFNLNSLAVLIGVPVHHLGYYFREVRKKHFSDYRNEWRIKHAKQLMQEGMRSTLTLEAIGMLCGFANRNAFCNTFKKVEGYSPSDYDAQLSGKITLPENQHVHQLFEMNNKSN